MKVGLLMAGISFGYKENRDFRHCFPNINRNLIEPLKQEHDVVSFIATYEHEHVQEMNDMYQSVATEILPYENSTQLNTRTKCLNLTEGHEIDFFIMTRFDVHFNNPLAEFNLDYEKFNVIARDGMGYWQSSSYVSDTFYAWPRSLHENIKGAFDDMNNTIPYQDGSHMHNFYHFVINRVGEENFHFMFDNFQLSGSDLVNLCTQDYVSRLKGTIFINEEILERFP